MHLEEILKQQKTQCHEGLYVFEGRVRMLLYSEEITDVGEEKAIQKIKEIEIMWVMAHFINLIGLKKISRIVKPTKYTDTKYILYLWDCFQRWLIEDVRQPFIWMWSSQ